MPLEDLSAEALLAIALATYRDEILPALPPDKRYVGAMVANALDIAARSLPADLATRETELAAALTGSPGDLGELARRFRKGEVPGGDEGARLLLKAWLERELAVRNPRFLESRLKG